MKINSALEVAPKKKRILVTGGAGFIGSHLCARLISEGHEVICLDNLFTGSKLNIAALRQHGNFKFTRSDILDPFEGHFDEIYNLACPASPIHYQHDPVKTVRTCVQGTINMLELARRTNARILQASTSEVYGDSLVHPQPETYWGNVNPIGIRSCYDEGKRCAETLCFDYHRQHKVDIRVVRIFNTYGPNMHPQDGRVVSNFIVQALTGEDITIYGDGEQSRSFQYIDDLIEGMIRMMNNETNLVGPVNLGSPNEFTIKQLAEKILKLIPQSSSKIVVNPLPQDDPKQRQPDISVAQSRLDWSPTISIDQGLVKTIEYFRQAEVSERTREPIGAQASRN